MAVLFAEPEADRSMRRLFSADDARISAGTYSETLLVADRRDVGVEARGLVARAGLRIEPVTAATAELTAEAYAAFGKGRHEAALNWGDCFAYALAKAHNAPLLFVGDDFTRTDVKAA